MSVSTTAVLVYGSLQLKLCIILKKKMRFCIFKLPRIYTCLVLCLLITTPRRSGRCRYTNCSNLLKWVQTSCPFCSDIQRPFPASHGHWKEKKNTMAISDHSYTENIYHLTCVCVCQRMTTSNLNIKKVFKDTY